MPIEINGQGTNNPVQSNRGERAEVNVGRSEDTAEQQGSGRSSTADTVSLTETSAQLQSLENSLAELPVVDSQRVEAIKQALADGSYQVDAQSVADKLINLERILDK